MINELFFVIFAILVSILSIYLIFLPLGLKALYRLPGSILLLGGLLLLYWKWSSFHAAHDYLNAEQKKEEVQAFLQDHPEPEKIIQQLRKQLQKDPKSAKGWFLLGRLYASEGKWQRAKESFATAYRLNPMDIKIAVNFAQSLFQNNQQQFTPLSLKIYNSVLQSNQNQPDALAMLAMNAFMSHDYKSAIAYWERLLKLAPQNSEEASAIRKAIARAQQREKGIGKQHIQGE
jgi:cytochrome c-type biogenesis protein CcmH